MKQLLTALILIFMNGFTHAQTLHQSGAIKYLVRNAEPASAKAPLIILLHGVGSNEKDLFTLAEYLPKNFLVVSARAPLILGVDSYGWYELNIVSNRISYNAQQAENSRNEIIKFITSLSQAHQFDNNKVYLCGFSQGAIITASVALTAPDMVKGAALMSGRINDETKKHHAPIEKMKHLKFFISHGVHDPTLAIEHGRNTRDFIGSLHLNYTYKEYPEGHTISNQMLSDLISWLKNNEL